MPGAAGLQARARQARAKAIAKANNTRRCESFDDEGCSYLDHPDDPPGFEVIVERALGARGSTGYTWRYDVPKAPVPQASRFSTQSPTAAPGCTTGNGARDGADAPRRQPQPQPQPQLPRTCSISETNWRGITDADCTRHRQQGKEQPRPTNTPQPSTSACSSASTTSSCPPRRSPEPSSCEPEPERPAGPPSPDAEAEARTAGPSRRHPDEVVDRGLREALLAAYGLQGQLAPDAPVLLVDLAAVKRSARNIRNANHCPPALVDYTGREFVVFARLPPKPGQAPGPGPGPARAPAGAAASGAGTGTGAYGGAAGAASAGGAGIIRVAPLAVCRQLKPGEAGDRRAAEGVVGAFRHATRLGAFKTQRRSANKTVPGATPLKTAGLTYAVYTRTSVPGLYAHQLGRPDREDAMVGVLRAVTGVLDAQHAPHMRMLRAYGRGHEYHGKGTGPFCTLSYTSNYHNRLHVDQDDPPLSFITWWLEGAGALRGGAFRLANLRIRFTPLQGTTLLLNTKELLHGTEACAPVPGRSGVRRIGAALWVREAVVHAWRQWRAGAMARYRERVGASGVRDRAKAIRKACEFAEKEVAKQGTGAAAERARVMREGARRMPAFCGDLFDEGAVRAAWGLWDVRTVQASAPARKPVAV